MFARTQRLTLRPRWPEDAAAITRAVAHESVVTKLAHLPWPYTQADAEAWLAMPRPKIDATCLILEHCGERPRLIGAIGIEETANGAELGYWLTPDAWGRGYATEAGHAMIGIARHALGLRRLRAGYYQGNEASGNVLRKLGFRETGAATRPCRALRRDVPSVEMACDLDVSDVPADLCLAA
ncbi:GNAT family N-acetyltransferase [Sphingomonas immobilis]|uniref:GNAT family N-acetyltransferase n=1 Tax=Sphingomonas immobilis TaxID=3063997 RepID=A0ABT8ZXE5_9SPHN|nr:GNAT family N-acetyltransferase [Sphingomonas sp. CA1-15]MDO7841968.1 GNAT family N-acetyltransferase [Sphingomonas sp. CA1-15]